MTQTYTHGENHLFSRPDRLHNDVHVITSIFNPMRYRTRYKLYQDFVRMVEASGATLWTVEIAQGNRDFSVTSPDNPHHLQLRTDTIAWQKERALNLMIERLPYDWTAAGWLDADVMFARSDWMDEVRHSLQIYDVVQPFSQAVDLGPNEEIINTFKGFAWCYHNDIPQNCNDYYNGSGKYKNYWHPGFGMFFTRKAFDSMGGLADFFIAGGSDLYMWRGLAGIDMQMPDSLGPSGLLRYKIWCERAQKEIKKNIGYVDGVLLHKFHGAKKSRAYKSRGSILIDAQFDVDKDVYYDYQGLWQLRKDNIALRDGLRKYFGQRNEDSLEL